MTKSVYFYGANIIGTLLFRLFPYCSASHRFF